MTKHAQSMEAKWRLKAPEAFYSNVSETAPADDKPVGAMKNAYQLGWDDGDEDANTPMIPEDQERASQAGDVVASFLAHLEIPKGAHHKQTWIDYCNGYCDGAHFDQVQRNNEMSRMMRVFKMRNGHK